MTKHQIYENFLSSIEPMGSRSNRYSSSQDEKNERTENIEGYLEMYNDEIDADKFAQDIIQAEKHGVNSTILIQAKEKLACLCDKEDVSVIEERELTRSINDDSPTPSVSLKVKTKTISQIRAECKDLGLVYDMDTKKCRPSKRNTKDKVDDVATSPKVKTKTIAQIRAECKDLGLVYDVDTKKCRPSKRNTKDKVYHVDTPPASPKVKAKTIAQIRAECKDQGLVYDVDTKKCRQSKKDTKLVTDDKLCVNLSVMGATASIRKKYADRASPPYPASGCPGSIKQGNNGAQYESVQNRAGIWTWRKKKITDIMGVRAVGPGIPAEFTTLVEDCEGINAWKKGKIIGHGSYGAIYIACTISKPKKCNYILKVQKDDYEFHQEVMALDDLKGVDFVVNMYAAWTCNGMGYIVQEKLNECDVTYEQVDDILNKLNDLGWLHTDSHQGNFMCKKDGTVVVIDFGWAVKKGEKGYKFHPWNKYYGQYYDPPLTYDELKIMQDRLVAKQFLSDTDDPRYVNAIDNYNILIKELDK